MLRRSAPWALFFILLLGIALRVYDVAGNPLELIVDELDLYNSAHSFALTGHDVDGTRLPYFYCGFTRNPPVYAVAEYVASLAFGNGPFGLRFAAIAFGLITVVLVYALTIELTRRRDIGLVAALLAATAPILIQFSRIGWEPASELPFLLGGLLCWLSAFRRLREGDGALPLAPLAGGAVLLGIAAYTYMAGWFYAALLGGGIIALNLRVLRSRGDWLRLGGALVLAVVIAVPALWMWFGDPETYGRTRGMSTFAGGVTFATIGRFLANYFAHFRWSYLVATGDPIPGATWRYLAGYGAFFWWVVPLAVIGIAYATRVVRERWMWWWMIWWLVTYPLGGALTNDGAPNAPRTLAGIPAFVIFAAIGLTLFFDAADRLPWPRIRARTVRVLRAGCALALASSLVIFARFYYTDAPRQYPNAWDSGTRATFAVIREHAAGYERLCFSIRPAWYGAPSYFRYYLADQSLQTIQSVTSAICDQPGTLLVTEQPLPRPGFMPIAAVLEVRGGPFATISGRPTK